MLENLGFGPIEIATLTPIVVGAIERLFELESGSMSGATIGDFLETLLGIRYVVDEDCLHLSVHTPRDPSPGNLDADLPVMVFVHGGAFMSGDQVMYDHARLGDAADVIVVSINYRLGPIGFMCLDTDEAAGNMGMLDQVMALQWVQQNIDRFGGNSSMVITESF